jgi:CTP synthase
MGHANSTEFDQKTPFPVVALVTEWTKSDGGTVARGGGDDLGGTMRLGAQRASLKEGSKCAQIYGATDIYERHRHRYEVNNTFLAELEEKGLSVSGKSIDNLVEMVEVPSHPWFVACQFHPEFKSTPRDGHPLFSAFVAAAGRHIKGDIDNRRTAKVSSE